MEFTHEEAMRILRMLTSHVSMDHRQEVSRILANLRDYSYACRAGNGEWDDEERDYQTKRTKKKLFDELAFIKQAPDITRIK